MKVVYCFDASSIFIGQNPNFRSRYKNVQHLLDSLMPPEFMAGGRSLFCMGIQMVEVNIEA